MFTLVGGGYVGIVVLCSFGVSYSPVGSP